MPTRDGPRGSTAGMVANAARRSSAAHGDPGAVLDALHAAAGASGERIARLRMLDYDAFAQRHPEAPTLGVVLATFGKWKHARTRAAAQQSPQGIDVAGSLSAGPADAPEHRAAG